MASEEMVSSRDFLTFNDDQLVDLLQKFQLADGNIDNPVSDFDKVSDKDGQRILTRLLNATKLMKARAVPLDLDRVNELLMVDRAGEAARLPSFACDSALTDDESHAETEEEDIVGDAVANERKSYAELVADGGRPLYPIEMLESVAKDPEQHRHLLQPYWRHPGVNYMTDGHLDWEVLQRQLRQRKAFRNWQLNNRRIIEEPESDAYVEQKASSRKHYRGQGLAKLESNPESLKGPNTSWEPLQSERARERRQFREQGCSSFTEYHAALQRRLAAHGFSEKTTLLADPRKQDALAEWHEYLGFECWWQDQYTREYKGHLKRYDQNRKFIQRQCQEWVTSDHTPEFIETWMNSSEPGAQRQEARREVQNAKSKAEKARRQHVGIESVDGGYKGITPHGLGDALQQLAEAEKRFKELDRLYDAIAQVSILDEQCDLAKAYVDSQPALIQWVIDQIPLIRAEMKVKAHGSATSGRRKKRTREDGQDASALPGPKLRKLAKPEETAESGVTATLVPEERATLVPEETATLVPEETAKSEQTTLVPEETATLVPEETVTLVPEETAESEQTTLGPGNPSRDGLRPRDKSKTDQMSSVAQPRRSARLSAKQNRTVAPTVSDQKTRVKKPARSTATRSRDGLRPPDKLDADQMSSVAQPRRSARLSAKQNRAVAPTVPSRKDRVKKPAQSAATRTEKKSSAKVDPDTGRREKRGGNKRSKPVSGK